MFRSRIFAFPALIAATTFIFTDCGKTVNPVSGRQEIDYNQAITKADAIIQVNDLYTRKPLDSVQISIVGNKPVITDLSGVTRISNLSVGDYLLDITKNGYEPVYTSLTMDSDSNSAGVPIVRQTAQTLYLAKKGVTIKGQVFYFNTKENKKYPAANAMLEVKLGNSSNFPLFKDPVRPAKVSQLGSFSLHDLPEYTGVEISVLPFQKDGINYRASTVSVSGNRGVGDTIFVTSIIMQESNERELLILSDNSKELTSASELTIKFSETIDPKSIKADSIIVYLSGVNTRVLTTFTINDDELRLKPFQGIWSNSASYLLHLGGVRGISGSKIIRSYSLQFRTATQGTLGPVTGLGYRTGYYDSLKADYSTSSVTLFWSKLANASSYEVYSRSKSDSVWLLTQSYLSDTTMEATLGYGALNNSGWVQYLVMGKNSETRSSLSESKILTIKDETRPRYNNNYYGLTISGLNNSSYHTQTIRSQTISGFSEPMDTTIKPIITAKEMGFYNSYGNIYGDTSYVVSKMDWKWITLSSATLTVTVDSLKNGAYDSLFIDISKFKDKAGNPFDITGSGSVIKIATR